MCRALQTMADFYFSTSAIFGLIFSTPNARWRVSKFMNGTQRPAVFSAARPKSLPIQAAADLVVILCFFLIKVISGSQQSPPWGTFHHACRFLYFTAFNKLIHAT
jgi:hypothetical protein